MRKLLATCMLLLLASPPAAAECECLWRGSFSEVHAETDLVVGGTVIASRGNAIDLEVTRLLSGRQPVEAIRIWLRTADYCRPEVELFPVGSQWVMALHEITEEVPGGFNPNTPNISYGRIGDYSLSSCGGYWLSLSGGRVTGNLVQAPRWERDPSMTPVLLELLADYVQGNLGRDSLLAASREDPALRRMMLDTRLFLREETRK